MRVSESEKESEKVRGGGAGDAQEKQEPHTKDVGKKKVRVRR